MSTLIMKFGGTSIGTSAALSQVLSIVLHEHKRWNRLLLIASALEGVTDMLLESAHLAQISNSRGYRRIAATLRARHLALIEQLPLGPNERVALQADIDNLLFEMLDICQTVANVTSDTLSPAITDQIVSIGEKLSARIIAALLRQNELRGVAIDGTDIIITDRVFGNATPDLELTQQKVNDNLIPMLDRQIIPVVTGFIGATPTGETTTIGRGGSDYTASILSLCIDADEVWIWSDVDGMMSTDPREIDTARVIPELSYDEVAELAYFGARILHARMIRPLQKRQTPLRIKNVYKPQVAGTLIRPAIEELHPRVKAITAIQGISLNAERSGSLATIAKLIDDVLFDVTGNRADVMISSQSSAESTVTFVVPTSAGPDAVTSLHGVTEIALKNLNDSVEWVAQPVTVVTAIGQNINQHLDLIADMLKTLEKIPVISLSQGPSQCSFSIVIAQDFAEEALKKLHDYVLKND